VSVGLYRKV